MRVSLAAYLSWTNSDRFAQVINQLDTTQSHLGPKPASAKPDFSKEELSAILKFGAQNM
jgi:hypothetical protein